MVFFLRSKLKILINDNYLSGRLVSLLLSKLLGLKPQVIGRSRSEDRLQRYALDMVEVERFLGYVAVQRDAYEQEKLKRQEKQAA